MKYLRNYTNTTQKNADTVVPIVYLINSNTSTVYFIKNLTLIESSTYSPTGQTSQKNTVNGITYNYKYTYCLTFASTSWSGKLIGLSINDGDIYWGTLTYSQPAANVTTSTYQNEEVYIYYYYKESSGQGGGTTQTRMFYSKNPLSGNITYKLYVR